MGNTGPLWFALASLIFSIFYAIVRAVFKQTIKINNNIMRHSMTIILNTENALLMAGQEKAWKASIEKFPKLIIYCDDIPVGVISVENKGEGEYYLGCLCVIPKYQSKGIGTQAVKYMLGYYTDWRKITLITPADKEENINFYAKKCGFKIGGTDMDGNVKVVHFLMER